MYQEYYGTGLLKAYSASDISWIGSVAIFLLYIGSPITGILVDRLGPTVSNIATGQPQSRTIGIDVRIEFVDYWQHRPVIGYIPLLSLQPVLSAFPLQAVLLGASTSLILTPCAAVVARRLPHRRGLALGITIGGSSIGGIIWPIMLQQLLYTRGVSFGWVQRAVGFTMLPLLAVACVTVVDAEKESNKPTPSESEASDRSVTGGNNNDPSPEEKPKTRHPIVAIFKNTAFVLLCLGLALTYLGLFTPFFYISIYAVSKGASSSTAFYLISAVNAASFFGRVVPGHLADRYGHFNICTLSVLTSGIIAFTWTAAYSLPGMILWGIAYGFTSGVRPRYASEHP